MSEGNPDELMDEDEEAYQQILKGIDQKVKEHIKTLEERIQKLEEEVKKKDVQIYIGHCTKCKHPLTAEEIAAETCPYCKEGTDYTGIPETQE